ncbi:MAG: hypothetical protein GKR89_17665 [Candidatus Latescibacteria bacterium]|nr:hypothetical protein [Candidatus Latescibacterota bacterium]
MQPLDYGHSMLIGNGPENEVRFWVESRTLIIDEESGHSEQYVQAGSCKSEHTFAEKDLFHADNYDFLPIFGPKWSIVYRRWADCRDQYKECKLSQQLWNGQQYRLVEGAGARLLEDHEAILAATHRWEPIVAQTEIWNEATRQRAIVEYPVKTLNTNRQGPVHYQVDSGPVVFPDLTRRWERVVEGMSLAFVAFNAPHFADFVLEGPTSIGPQGQDAAVHHYSHLLTLEAKNRLYALNAV